MFSQDDDHQGLVLGVVFGVIALVIGLVIGLSIYKTRGGHLPAPTPARPSASASAGVFTIGPVVGAAAARSAIVVEPDVVKIYFYPEQTDLPIGATEALGTMAQQVVAGKTLAISGYHDANVSPGKSAELARQRTIHVRDLLASLGVPPEKMKLQEPVAVTLAGGADDALARRVEVIAR